ncbi:MAG: 2-amino-4-hydroxy-6-hydroxymethyldihydropteridine diphosphokinase [Anaerolineae bacterium]|nr:2-amino-4-hydroxy-6-hydroxymethyldihydropteridine diphosphokinase [Anaerolineae bacterium]
MNKAHCIYLALGANLGHRENNLKEAVQKLPPPVEVLAVSRLYETAPAYVPDQPAFLNMALKGQTDLPPPALLAYLKQIEAKMGRRKSIRYGPRQIDLDIIFYDDLVLATPSLQIPHPRLAERAFVLRPLADIAAEVAHPLLKRTVGELLADLPAEDGILRAREWAGPETN